MVWAIEQRRFDKVGEGGGKRETGSVTNTCSVSICSSEPCSSEFTEA